MAGAGAADAGGAAWRRGQAEPGPRLCPRRGLTRLRGSRYTAGQRRAQELRAPVVRLIAVEGTGMAQVRLLIVDDEFDHPARFA